MKRRLIRIVILIALLGGAAYGAHRWRESRAAGENGESGLTLYGNVDVRQVALGFRVQGRIAEVRFEEGERVQPGDVVATLDREPFEEEVALNRAQVEAASAELQRLENGFRAQEIESARALVAEREATLANFEREFQRRQQLFEQDVVAAEALDNVTARREEAVARLQSAREQLALMEEGFRDEEIAAARANLSSAQARLERARTDLSDTEVVAPSPGTVLTRALEPGSIARIGDTVLTVSLTDPIWVRAYLPEPDLGRIHPGMRAEVFTDSRPDRPYTGHIGFISPEAEFTPKSVETPDLRTRLVYRFRVVVENPDEGLRQGMPVTVRLPNGASASAG